MVIVRSNYYANLTDYTEKDISFGISVNFALFVVTKMLSKLKIDTSQPLWLIEVPDNIDLAIDGIQIHETLAGKEDIGQLLLFAENRKALDPKLDKIFPRLVEKAVFWVAYPKKSGRIQSDLIRDKGWDKVFASGYRVVNSAAINDDWSAVRISKIDANRNYKSSTPMEERKTPGIDYVNRTAKLQGDIRGAFKEFEGLCDFFESMSFTHKRECIEHIEEAKKPETRQRRIDKIITTLLDMQQKKLNKKKK